MRGVLRSIVVLALGLTQAAAAIAAAPVELELLMDGALPPLQAHEWMNSLKSLNLAALRLREARRGERPEVRNIGTERSPRYLVLGQITPANTLLLPGGQFRMTDRAGLSAWLAKLDSAGVDQVAAPTGAFGLTAKELVALHEQLSVPLAIDTLGKRPVDVARTIVRSVPLTTNVDPAAQQAMHGDELVGDELAGLSAGTALAAVLRPLGLVMVPEKSGAQVRLRITEVRSAPQSWPVGWPAQKPPKDTLPEFFRFLNVEINDTPIGDSLDAIRQRLKTPILYDHNGLARQNIDPAKVKVSLPSSKTYYKQIVDRLCSQAKLISEIRVDEAGKPFLWIAPLFR